MKSLSDLEKLNVNEDLLEMERAEQLLKTGLDKQKISVLSSLPKILSSNNSKSNLVLVLDCMKVKCGEPVSIIVYVYVCTHSTCVDGFRSRGKSASLKRTTTALQCFLRFSKAS